MVFTFSTEPLKSKLLPVGADIVGTNIPPLTTKLAIVGMVLIPTLPLLIKMLSNKDVVVNVVDISS